VKAAVCDTKWGFERFEDMVKIIEGGEKVLEFP
jgi:hypothetical protein